MDLADLDEIQVDGTGKIPFLDAHKSAVAQADHLAETALRNRRHLVQFTQQVN